MTTLTWPASIKPQSVTWHLQANTGSFTSPLTRSTQTYEFSGARWVADLVFPALTQTKWRELSTFLTRLRGASGRCYVNPWHVTGITAPTYGAPGVSVDNTTYTCDDTTITADSVFPTSLGTPLVKGASQTGATLLTDGWEPMIYVALAGDHISYDTTTGRTLHMIVADAQSDSFGNASLSVEPPIRTAPADNAAIEITTPSCVMRLSDDTTGAMTHSQGNIANLSLSLVEAF